MSDASANVPPDLPPTPSDDSAPSARSAAAPSADAPSADAPSPQKFPCGQCGAQLAFVPGVEKLRCEYCGFQNEIEAVDVDIEELDYEHYVGELRIATDDPDQFSDHIVVNCNNCAAEIDRPTDATSFACPYCGSNIVAQGHVKRLLNPSALLPFKIERLDARARHTAWLKSLWFAPNDLVKFARLEGRLNGLYVPYWTYDARTVSNYTGMRGEYYYVTVGSGKNRRRQRRTRWYPASGTVKNTFDDVLVIATESLPTKFAEKLEPWDLHQLTPYQDAFLSGFLSEAYQVDLVSGFARAREIMKRVIRRTVKQDIGGDTQQVHSVSTRYHAVTFKHILLPIWICTYRYRDKSYRFLINGRTGEVQGERPWSAWKIALAVLGAAAVGAGIFLRDLIGEFLDELF